MHTSHKFCLMLSAVMLFSCGCNSGLKTDYGQLGLIDVSGRIKFDGRPLANAYVKFEADDGTYSFGKTDSSGDYKLWFNTEKTGIIPGEKTVRIRLSGAYGAEGGMLDGKGSGFGEGETFEEADPSENADIEELPDAYHSKSVLRATVSSSTSSLNFDLQADGSTKGPVQ